MSKKAEELCDNTDHRGKIKDLQEVRMKEEFEGGLVKWCVNCRKRDWDFIAEEGDEGKIYTEFMDYVREKLDDTDFWKWVGGWLDPMVVIDITKGWDISEMETELAKWKKAKPTEDYFAITRLSREDIKGDIKKQLKLTDKQINAIPDIDMEHIASKMGERYVERDYWFDLEELIRNYFQDHPNKNPFKSGDRIRFRNDALRRIYVVHTIYSPTELSLGLYGFPDTEQDNQVNIKDIKRVIKKKGGKK